MVVCLLCRSSQSSVQEKNHGPCWFFLKGVCPGRGFYFKKRVVKDDLVSDGLTQVPLVGHHLKAEVGTEGRWGWRELWGAQSFRVCIHDPFRLY